MLPTFILSFLIIPFNFSVPHDFILQLLFILYFTYTLLCMLWVFLFSNLSYLVSWSIIFRISSSLMLWKITQDFPSLLCVFHESNYRNEMAKKSQHFASHQNSKIHTNSDTNKMRLFVYFEKINSLKIPHVQVALVTAF